MLPFLAHSQSLSHDLDSILQKTFPVNRPGGALLVVENDRIIFKKAIGLADLEKRKPLTAKTNFRMASVSKQFTAMAILLLEKQGKQNRQRKVGGGRIGALPDAKAKLFYLLFFIKVYPTYDLAGF
ncbi:MAG: serine hydrolase domain-containing protein, partial [Bacteroidota bacterium]